jgi:hypothetical protein
MALAPYEVAQHEETAARAAGPLGSVRAELLAFAATFTEEALLQPTRVLADTVAAIEELSKVVEHLQVIGAHAVEQQNIAAVGETSERLGFASAEDQRTEFRDNADYLRARLGISRREARRRIRLGSGVLPGVTVSGQLTPPVLAFLAAAAADGEIGGQAATLILESVERVQPGASVESATAMEEQLVRQSMESDVDVLRVVARHWESALDPDGKEPSEELLQARQGVFYRGKRHGLRRLEIVATDDQYEHLVTAMNAATNPRLPGARLSDQALSESGLSEPEPASGGCARSAGAADVAGSAEGVTGIDGSQGATIAMDQEDRNRTPQPTRAQKLLDGLVGACRIALSSDKLPAAGGHRPQVMVTISYEALADGLRTGRAGLRHGLSGSGNDGAGSNGAGNNGVSLPYGSGLDLHSGPDIHSGLDNHSGLGEAVFGGPISAKTIRKIACDADLIPVVLGGAGQILDVGRAQRLFPPAMRRALAARDRGCAFPDCTMPAPWCEAHHITSWQHGGSTSTDNGVLLCSSHHHLVHEGFWGIQSRTGIPWFIPPPYVDPQRKPRRNRYRLAGVPLPVCEDDLE